MAAFSAVLGLSLETSNVFALTVFDSTVAFSVVGHSLVVTVLSTVVVSRGVTELEILSVVGVVI